MHRRATGARAAPVSGQHPPRRPPLPRGGSSGTPGHHPAAPTAPSADGSSQEGLGRGSSPGDPCLIIAEGCRLCDGHAAPAQVSHHHSQAATSPGKVTWPACVRPAQTRLPCGSLLTTPGVQVPILLWVWGQQQGGTEPAPPHPTPDLARRGLSSAWAGRRWSLTRGFQRLL